MFFDVLVHNTNQLTLKGDDDLCFDKGTWPTQCHGEAVSRIYGKNVSMGGQTVIATDVERFRLRAVVHRHGHHKKPSDKQFGTLKGPIELKMCLDSLAYQVKDLNSKKGIRQSMTNHPISHSTTFSLVTPLWIMLGKMVLVF